MRGVYERALRLLPRPVREEYGGDMLLTFDERALQAEGAQLTFMMRELLGLVSFAVRERIGVQHGRMPPQRHPGRLDVLLENLRGAARTLSRSPGFTTLSIGILALGIGMTTAIFSALDAVLLRPSPYASPDELVSVQRTMSADNPEPIPWSWDTFRIVRERGGPFSDVAAFFSAAVTLTGLGEPARVQAEFVSDNYLSLLGIGAAAGRVFAPGQGDAAALERMVLLSHDAWRERFNAGDVLGSGLTLNGKAAVIGGVLPPGFRGESGDAELFMPVELATDVLGDKSVMQPWAMWLDMLARLRPGVTPEAAAEQMMAMNEAVVAEGTYAFAMGEGRLPVKPLQGSRVEPAFRRALLLVFVTASLVMLVVCLNISSLLLVRTQGRQRELAIRGALGATRGRLAAQLMTESLLLSVLGGAAGIAIAYWLLNVLDVLRPEPTPGFWASYARALDAYDFRLDARVLAFTTSLTAVAGLLCGLLPALRARMDDLAARMRGALGPTDAGTRHTMRSRAFLVTAEITLAFLLVSVAGLVAASLARMQGEELGFEAPRVTTMRLQLPTATHTRVQARQFYEQLADNIGTMTGVASVSVSSGLPVSGRSGDTDFVPVDRQDERFEPIDMQVVTPRHFETLGIRLRSGRFFTPADDNGVYPVIISAEAASRLWPGENPVGRQAFMWVGSGTKDPLTVVGVVEDVQYRGVGEEIGPIVYIPMSRAPVRSAYVNVRMLGAGDITGALRAEVARLDPALAITEIRTMDERMSAATSRTRFSAVLIGSFAVVAALLALLGVYGLVAYSVHARSREIGVRLALGGQPGNVIRLIMGDVSRLALLGVLLGLAGSLGAARLVQSQLYDVQANDPRLLGSAALVMLAAAALAAYVPARRVRGISASAELMRQ